MRPEEYFPENYVALGVGSRGYIIESGMDSQERERRTSLRNSVKVLLCRSKLLAGEVAEELG